MRFLLVDEIRELDPGRSIVASKRLPASEELFRDHFPGFPVVPGVLLTEMMAQAAGKCLNAEGTHPGRAILARIESASFRSWVRPDEDVLISAQISQNQPDFATAQCHVEVRGRRVGSARLFFAFVSSDTLGGDDRDPLLDAWRARPSADPETGR